MTEHRGMAAGKALDKGLSQTIYRAIQAMRKSEELILRTNTLLIETRQILQQDEELAKTLRSDSGFRDLSPR